LDGSDPSLGTVVVVRTSRWSLFRQVTYAVLAAVGAVATTANNLAHDGSALDFLRDATSSPAARSLTIDLAVLAAACVVLVLTESRRLGIKRPWLYLVLCGVVAAAFAIPLFLLVRERVLERTRQAQNPPSNPPKSDPPKSEPPKSDPKSDPPPSP
jgi:hypothetical protein